MRNYLILRERASAFRSDPEVAAARGLARVDELARATLDPGETLGALRAEAFDPDAAAARGCGFEKLDQLALDYLYGVRS
jgi:xylose isomerase